MNGEQVAGVLLVVLVLAALTGAVVSDARAQRRHERWAAEWQAWIWGGMKGPRP